MSVRASSNPTYFHLSLQDFDTSGDHYRKYVEKKNLCLRLAVPWSQRLKCMVSRLTVVCFSFASLDRLPDFFQNRKSADFERILRPSLNRFFVLKDLQRRETNGRVPIPIVNTVLSSVLLLLIRGLIYVIRMSSSPSNRNIKCFLPMSKRIIDIQTSSSLSWT